jgi:AcrR family transcriptional regulator
MTIDTDIPVAVEPARSMRADARRNREKLLVAAVELFAGAGEDVPLEAIAERAGVGIGTLYRHFPTREALVAAVYRAERGRLAEAADELLAEQCPDRALRSWMDLFADYMATKREMAESLRALVASGAVTQSEARKELSGAVQRLLDAGAAAGTLRADLSAEDVVVGVLGIFTVCTLPEQRDQATRLLDLLMDGMRRSRQD